MKQKRCKRCGAPVTQAWPSPCCPVKACCDARRLNNLERAMRSILRLDGDTYDCIGEAQDLARAALYPTRKP